MMRVLAVILSVLLCVTPVTMISGCTVSLWYDFTAGVTPAVGTGYMEVSPLGSVVTATGTSTFSGSGMLKMYRFSAQDWRGDHSISFVFQPSMPVSMTGVSVLTNNANDNAGSFMITWKTNEVQLKLMLRRWDTVTLQFVTRTEILTVTGLDMTQPQEVRFSKTNQEVQFQSGPLLAGGYPAPLTLSLNHDEYVEIVSWDPLLIGTGVATQYSGTFDDFKHYECTPANFFN